MASMTRIAAALTALLGVLAFSPATAGDASSIPNDDFPGETISTFPFTDSLSTVDATTEPGEPSGSCLFGAAPLATVWYNFTPSEDILLRADTLGSDYDTIITGWTQSSFPGGSLAEVGCSDDIGPGDSGFAFEAQAGRTYYIQAGGYPSSNPTGNLIVDLQQVFPPDNDDLADATVIDSLPFSDSVDTGGAATETGEPSPSCSIDLPIQSTVWYEFTPVSDAAVVIDVTDSTFDAMLGAWVQSETGLSEVACNFGLLGFEAHGGTTYYVQAGGIAFFGPASGVLNVSIDFLNVPDCAPAEYTYNDSLGDTFGPPPHYDIGSVSGGSDDDHICFQIELTDATSPLSIPVGEVTGLLALDIDQNSDTGIPGFIEFFCQSPSEIGIELLVSLYSSGGLIASILDFEDPFGPFSLPQPPVTDYAIQIFDESSVTLIVPLDLLGGDDQMDAVFALGNFFEPTDCAPDSGYLSLPLEPAAHGDIDCDGDVDAVDALRILTHLAGLPVPLPTGCASIGAPAGVPALNGDIDCDGDIDAVDALQVLRYVAGLPVSQESPCTPVGQ